MRRAFILAILVAVPVAVAAASAVLATHTSAGLASTLLGRSQWDRADLTAFVRELGAMHAPATSDVAVVRATLSAGGTTDWHGHPGPSVVVVTAGTIRVIGPASGGGCTTVDYPAGQAFFHSTGAHNFRNPGSSPAEFLVTYVAPPGALLTHEPAPAGC